LNQSLFFCSFSVFCYQSKKLNNFGKKIWGSKFALVSD